MIAQKKKRNFVHISIFICQKPDLISDHYEQFIHLFFVTHFALLGFGYLLPETMLS
jgi:hypothetical protein